MTEARQARRKKERQEGKWGWLIETSLLLFEFGYYIFVLPFRILANLIKSFLKYIDF